MRVRSSRKAPYKRIFYTALTFIAIVGVGMLLPRVFSFVGGVIMMPIHGISQWYQTSEQLVPAVFRDRSELLAEIEQLEAELISASAQTTTNRRLQEENNRLRSLLGAEQESRTVARVLARPQDLPYDLVQIDQGSSAGIKENTLVYANDDQLLGLVSHVSFAYSLVTLFTSPGSEMTGFVSGPDVTATVEGIGGGVARIRVPQGIPLSIGDLVYVPSVQPGLFGQIDFVESRPSQPEQFGYITLAVPLRSLYEVAIADVPVESASVASIQAGQAAIISERLLVEEANTVSFEELLASSTPATSTVEVTDIEL